MSKATDFYFGLYIHRVHPHKRLLKIFRKSERGRIQGLPKVFRYPLLSQERFKLRTSNSAGTFAGPIRTKDRYKLSQKEAWAYPGAAQKFYYLRNGLTYELLIWLVHLQCPPEQTAIKYLGQKVAWAYPGAAKKF